MDECDKLFELGFLKQVDKLVAACTKENLQIALFSATILPQIEELSNSILADPVQVVIGEKCGSTTLLCRGAWCSRFDQKCCHGHD
jgi:ATP-dependent RNA helicase DDX52/ROK1